MPKTLPKVIQYVTRERPRLGSLVDRFTRMILLGKLHSAHSAKVLHAFCSRLRSLSAHRRRAPSGAGTDALRR